MNNVEILTRREENVLSAENLLNNANNNNNILFKNNFAFSKRLFDPQL